MLHATRKYRADIDGLRAIAVMAVVLDHFMFAHTGGGYIGVDVFFVISGYLIGSSLITEMQNGNFRFSDFYERRVRRILPALLGVLVFTSFLAYHYLQPKALVDYTKSCFAALLSFSNFFFWSQSGYFDPSNEVKPLLHTWSLGVEEQFYLLFPVFLLLVIRYWRRYLRAILWGVALLTFGLSVWVVHLNATTAFFWSPLRAWELLGGTLVSQYRWSALQSRWMREGTALAGLAMILYPVVEYTPYITFPGEAALLPCVGTILVIGVGQVGDSFVGGLLSTPPFRFLGAISYSLYLWHWPLHVFQNTGLLFSDRPSTARSTKLLLLAISLVLSTLSWWLVETPFRKGRFRPGRARLFSVVGAAAAVLILVNTWFVAAKGLPGRFSPEVLRIGAFTDYDTAQAWRQGSCFIVHPDKFSSFQPGLCASPDDPPTGSQTVPQKNILIYGDSTAAQLYPGFQKISPAIHVEQATSAICTPSDVITGSGGYVTNCQALVRYIHGPYLASNAPDAVLLAARWKPNGVSSLGEEIAFFQQHHISVVLFGPDVSFDTPLPTLMSLELMRHESDQQRADRVWEHLQTENQELDKKLAVLARDTWKIHYVSYFDSICSTPPQQREQWVTTNGCRLMSTTGEPLAFDEHHLTLSASADLANYVSRQNLLP